jgi:4-hydroxyphenylacetate 3-monooxygenase
MRAGIYARVSTLEQDCNNQLFEIRRYIEARGWTAVEYVDRGVSGAKDKRPALDALLKDAKRRRFDVLVCWRLDRLGRNLRHLVTMLEDLQHALIALGILDAITIMGAPPERIAAARAYRDHVAETGRFITFSSGGTVPGSRHSPEDRLGCRIVRETSDGVIVTGFLGMHTAVPYADDVFVYGGRLTEQLEQWIWFAVRVNAPGVRIYTRPASAPESNPYTNPLSSRYDELDAAVYLDNVLIPWDRVFMYRYDPLKARSWRHDGITGWICWHQVIGWLARAEFTLGLALALADCNGLMVTSQRDRLFAIRDELLDLIVHGETVRACLTAAELEPEQSAAGYLRPRMTHVACAALYCTNVRERMNDCLRRLAGSAPLVAPADSDVSDARVAAELERAFGGGGYTATQRSALLHLAWDHLSSSLSGREGSFELLGSGGIEAWKRRVQQSFERYSEVANAAIRAAAVEMPAINLDVLRDLGSPWAPRRTSGAPAVPR